MEVCKRIFIFFRFIGIGAFLAVILIVSVFIFNIFATTYGYKIEYTEIAACAAVIAALVGIYKVLDDNKLTRFKAGVDLIMSFDTQFRGNDYIVIRKKAITFLTGNKKDQKGERAVGDILNFFEGIAYFTNRGLIDKETTWCFFFTYLYRFWHLADSFIVKERNLDKTLWTELIAVYPKLLKIEHQSRIKHSCTVNLTSKDFENFILTEFSQ